ncbi:MAG: OB-fold nucleic acid binding domain-containing protein [Acidimicrobiales bacterium]|jgi:hypothetical protein
MRSGLTPIASVPLRSRAWVEGVVTATACRVIGSGPAFECVLEDRSGEVVLVFLGRREISGIERGRRLAAGGTFASREGRLEVLNPLYDLL